MFCKVFAHANQFFKRASCQHCSWRREGYIVTLQKEFGGELTDQNLEKKRLEITKMDQEQG